MRYLTDVHLTLLPALLWAQGPNHDSVEALIKRLASPKFQERQTATQMLLNRPEAVPALRDALRSPDLEVARRAALILAHFDGRPLRDLKSAIKEGRISHAIELLADWPKEKNEEEVFAAVAELARDILDLHHKQRGKKLSLNWYHPADPRS